MPSSPEELEQALKSFRDDILTALAGLRVEIEALHSALLEGPPLSPDRLKKLRQQAKANAERHKGRYAESIAPAHEL